MSSSLVFGVCLLSLSFLHLAWPTTGEFTPVVLMHGIANTSESMRDVKFWIEQAYPGIYVKNMEIGNGYYDSFFMNLNDQAQIFCEQLANDPLLKDHKFINLVGYSLGGLVTRGFIQRCNVPKVYNYITWSTPHAGIFGIPNTNPNSTIWQYVYEMIKTQPYDPIVQDHLTIAEMWKDTFDLDYYLDHNIYLPDINNERPWPYKNETYRQNMMSVNSLTLLWSTVDTVIYPQTSSMFEFYAPHSDVTVVPLRETDWYKGDWLGLRTLDESGRLFTYGVPCEHGHYPDPQCKGIFDMYTLPLLNTTV